MSLRQYGVGGVSGKYVDLNLNYSGNIIDNNLPRSSWGVQTPGVWKYTIINMECGIGCKSHTSVMPMALNWIRDDWRVNYLLLNNIRSGLRIH